MTNKPIKVAIYARVSTEEQAEQGYSIDAQLDTLRDYCRRNGKEIYDEYVDAGISGKPERAISAATITGSLFFILLLLC